jgi:hypothetical protein
MSSLVLKETGTTDFDKANPVGLVSSTQIGNRMLLLLEEKFAPMK